MLTKNDIVAKNMFLEKYGGMSWKDADEGFKLVTACTKNVHFGKKQATRGYHIIGLALTYDPDNID